MSDAIKAAISRTRSEIEAEGWTIERTTTGDKVHLVMTRGDERKGFGLMGRIEGGNWSKCGRENCQRSPPYCGLKSL